MGRPKKIENMSKVEVQDLVKLGALTKEEINSAALELSGIEPREVKFVVDEFYFWQNKRIADENQNRSLNIDNKKFSNTLHTLSSMSRQREEDIYKILEKYSQTHPVMRWMNAIKGVGPIMSSMFGSSLDVTKAQGRDTHASHFWSYCGLNNHNNPWLGQAAAKESVKEIYKEIDDKVTVFTDYIEENLDSKNSTKVFKSISTIYKNIDKFDSSCLVHCIIYKDYDEFNETTKKAFKVLEEYNGILRDYQNQYENLDLVLAHSVYPNIVCSHVRAEVFRKHDRTMQKIDNGLRGIVKNSKLTGLKRYLEINNKDTLIKYLSKIPYNADLKTLCYKLSDVFVKNSNRGSLYGELYKMDKERRIAKNNNGDYAEYAAKCLKDRKGSNGSAASIEAYKQGKIPLSQIEKQARRFAVQIFISHLYEILYMYEYNVFPDDCYCIKHMGHTDYIGPEVDFFEYIERPKDTHVDTRGQRYKK